MPKQVISKNNEARLSTAKSRIVRLSRFSSQNRFLRPHLQDQAHLSYQTGHRCQLVALVMVVCCLAERNYRSEVKV